jgi:hypothetical protein
MRERCAPHRLGTIDREDDGLLRAEVLRPVDPDGSPFSRRLGAWELGSEVRP